MRRILAILVVVAALAALPGTAPARTADVGARIIGGTPAPAGAWPSFAQLTIRKGGQYFLCGGTLITPTVVLTAAHCVNGATTAQSTARVGITTINTGTAIAWSSATIHPSYDPTTLDYDIALVELASASPAPTMPLIPPVAEPLLTPGSLLKVAGFGLTATGGSTSRTLLELSVPLVSDATCDSAYTNAGYFYDALNMLCAGTDATDSCNGDSGGALTLTENGVAFAAGLVSWGPISGCAATGLPGVYARVSALRDWVRTDPTVAPWVATQAAVASIGSVTSAGSRVTATWSVSGGNWTTTGFQSTLNGAFSTDGTFARSVDAPTGGTVTVAVTPIVATGAATPGAWSGTPTPTRAPVVTAAISGTAAVGATLTATGASDDPWGTAPAFQWTADGSPIPGATTTTYVIPASQTGRRIGVDVRATNAVGTGFATAATGPVTATPRFARTSVPVRGRRIVGAKLSVTAPRVVANPTAKITYQWLRNGKAIKGKTKRTYVVAKADRGKRLTCRITAKNAVGTTKLVSRPARIPA